MKYSSNVTYVPYAYFTLHTYNIIPYTYMYTACQKFTVIVYSQYVCRVWYKIARLEKVDKNHFDNLSTNKNLFLKIVY